MKKLIFLVCIISLLSSCGTGDINNIGKGDSAIANPTVPVETNF